MYFSIAPQTVTDPVTGTRITFDVDPADSAIVHCRVWANAEAKDYFRMTFARNGMARDSIMVDAEVEEDERLRAEAAARLARAPAATSTPEDRKAAEEAAAKQVEADKALLASPPKVSKHVVPDAPKVEPPTPAVLTPHPPEPYPTGQAGQQNPVYPTTQPTQPAQPAQGFQAERPR